MESKCFPDLIYSTVENLIENLVVEILFVVGIGAVHGSGLGRRLGLVAKSVQQLDDWMFAAETTVLVARAVENRMSVAAYLYPNYLQVFRPVVFVPVSSIAA